MGRPPRERPVLPEGLQYVSDGGTVGDPDWRQRVNGSYEAYQDKHGHAAQPPRSGPYMRRLAALEKEIDEDPDMPDRRKISILGAIELMKSRRASVRAQGCKMYNDMVGYTTEQQQAAAKESTLQALREKAERDTSGAG